MRPSRTTAGVAWLLCLTLALALGPAGAQPLSPGMSDNTDRPGGDLTSAPSVSPQECLKTCRAYQGCKSWTYVRPGFQGSGGVCYLKGSIPNVTPNPCCVSGFRGKTVPNLTGTVAPNIGAPQSEVVVNTAADKRCPKAVRATSVAQLGYFLGQRGEQGDGAPVLTSRPDEDVKAGGFIGCIIIPKDAAWRMDQKGLEIQPGVSLIGERGELGSRPTLFTDDLSQKYCLFTTNGEDVRIEGIQFRGPGYPGGRPKNASAVCITRNPLNKSAVTLIADNEFGHWTGEAVRVKTPYEANSDKEYRDNIRNGKDANGLTWPPHEAFSREDARLVRIERNYFHHNLQEAVGGYGVSVGSGAFAEVVGNVFDTNRHSVASNGRAHSGYIARYNFILNGGVKEDGFYNQHFDVHGTGEDGYNGQGGNYYEIANNTVRGAQSYYLGKTRPVFMLRARPTNGAYFNNNVVAHCSLDDAISIKTGHGALHPGIFEDEEAFDFHESGNTFNADPSSEIAAGDFDGDQRSDVFVATGTAWFYSRGGVRPWEFLRASDKRMSDLAFADMDNDGVTDVLAREGANVIFVKSGRYPPSRLASLPVAVSEVLFGDFDADGLRDMFYVKDRQWMVWYGRSREWTRVQSSRVAGSAYLVGEFDDTPGSDIVATQSGVWSVSSGATAGWEPLNSARNDSLADAVAADFDGDGRTDIALGYGNTWYFSRGGRGPLTLLRKGSERPYYAELKDLAIGAFDGGGRVQAIGFEMFRTPHPPCGRDGESDALVSIAGTQLKIWDGYGGSPNFVTRSTLDMR